MRVPLWLKDIGKILSRAIVALGQQRGNRHPGAAEPDFTNVLQPKRKIVQIKKCMQFN
jgi:hypothetical protein